MNTEITTPIKTWRPVDGGRDLFCYGYSAILNKSQQVNKPYLM